MDTSRFDYTFEQTAKLEVLKRNLLSNFELRGYRQIHLSAFESTETFVEQKGENVRQRIFTLNGDTESELCLRPELTVPACKFYLKSLAGKMDYCRMCYEGLVWQMDPIRPGFFGEFTQAGVELIGNYCEIGADTEVLELAIETLTRCGISISNVVVNDVRILKCVFDTLNIGQKPQSLIEQALIVGNSVSDLPVKQAKFSEINSVFEDVLDLVGPEKLAEFLVEILALQGYSQDGNCRTPQDVADRFIRRKSSEKNELTQEQLDILLELLEIAGDVDDVAMRLRGFAKKHDVSEVTNYVDAVSDKIRLLKIALPEEASPQIEWRLSFLRSFKYYSGLIFDINSKNEVVCGGGRYDDLFDQIGAKGGLKAAGFAIGVDHLLSEHVFETDCGKTKAKAILAPLGSGSYEQCFAVAKDLRDLDWIVETDYSGANIKNIITRAVRGGADLLLLIGEDEISNASVTVKQLAAKTQETISISNLKQFLISFNEMAGEA